MDFTNYLADRLVKCTVGTVNYTAPTAVYLGLYTADPTKAGFSSNEVDAASYNRQLVKFSDPKDGVATNDSQVDWNTATSDWGNVGWVSVMDAPSGGFMLYFKALENPKEVLSGDQLKIDANKLQLTLT